MKFLVLFILSFFSLSSTAQSLLGAWEAKMDDEGRTLRNVVIIAEEGYQVATFYDAETGAFLSTNGGTWQLDSTTPVSYTHLTLPTIYSV